jgi:hypothetical protein
VLCFVRARYVYCVVCVICVLYLIVVSLALGKNPFSVKINNNNNGGLFEDGKRLSVFHGNLCIMELGLA